MGDTEPTSCTYLLDDDLRITGVDEAFERFAVENAAPELCGTALVGRRVLSCISDETTAHLYKHLYERVLREGARVTLPIRCDGPTVRRFLDVHIEPRRPTGLLVRNVVTRVEERPYMSLLDREARRVREQLLVICGWCNAVGVSGRWCEVEEAVQALRLFEQELMPILSHGVCHTCLERVSAA